MDKCKYCGEAGFFRPFVGGLGFWPCDTSEIGGEYEQSDKCRITQLEAENAALKARLDDWRSFTTAPEDGTEIIAWREDAGVFAVKFYRSGPTFDDGPPDLYDCCWWADGEDLTGDLPTLWRPLPSPPSKAAIEAAEKASVNR